MWICREKCGECCGCIPIPLEIYSKNKHLIDNKIELIQTLENEVYIITDNGLCVFLDENKRCQIYNDRPKVCRDYGTIEELLCPYIKMNGRQRTETGIRTTKRKIDCEVSDSIKRLWRG